MAKHDDDEVAAQEQDDTDDDEVEADPVLPTAIPEGTPPPPDWYEPDAKATFNGGDAPAAGVVAASEPLGDVDYQDLCRRLMTLITSPSVAAPPPGLFTHDEWAELLRLQGTSADVPAASEARAASVRASRERDEGRGGREGAEEDDDEDSKTERE